MRSLQVLGQRLGHTGSGVLLQAVQKAARRAGDDQILLSLGYRPPEQERDPHTIYASKEGEEADLPFPIFGMSDAMPYRALRYRDLDRAQIDLFRDVVLEKIRDIAADFRPDIVHFHHLWTLVSLAPRLDLPCVVTIHGTGLKLLRTAPQWKSLVEEGLPRIRHVFSISRHDAKAAQGQYDIPDSKVSIVGNGFDPEIFYPLGDRPRPHESDSWKRPFILFAGKFVDWKGIQHLFRAVAGLEVPHRLVICGTGPSRQAARLKALAAELDIEERVLFTGHLPQPDLAGWMRRSAVFVLPSIVEPFGMVLLEALACGSAAIAANIGGPSEFIPEPLRSKGLVDLVPPLRASDARAEKQYAADLRQALARLLTREAFPEDSTLISSSVAHLTWDDHYRSIRETYARVAESHTA